MNLSPVTNHEKLFAKLLAERANLPGDIAEFGVYNGGSTRQLAALAPDRKVWAFDTFEGLPEAEYLPHLDSDPPGKFAPTTDPGLLFLDCPNVRMMVGLFRETLPRVPANTQFMLVYLDCDYYRSYRQVLGWLPGRLVDGAVIVVDDYHYSPGAKKAVDQFVLAYPVVLEANGVIVWHEGV